MHLRPGFASKILLPLCLALLAACGSERSATIDVVAIGDAASPFESGARLSAAAQLLRGATAQGLVALDHQGQVVPGLADRWIVTDDGLSYIFRLSNGTWSGGSKLDATSARTALLQAIAGLRGTALARDLAEIGEIRVMTRRVIEIRLKRSQPDLLLLLAQPELGLFNRGKGAGPMALRRDGTTAYLALLDPERRGLPATAGWEDMARPLRLRALPAEAAIARFDAGDTDAILGGRFESFPLAGSGILSRAAIRLDPAIGLFGLVAVHADGFLANPQNREAITMAIDREALPAALGIGGWAMSERILPLEIEELPEFALQSWASLPLPERQAIAASRVARWRGSSGEPVRLRIAMPPGPGTERLFGKLAADLSAAGLSASRVGMAEPADLRLLDVAARYAKPAWFFNQLSCGVLPGPCSKEADSLLAKALNSADQTDRINLFAQTEEQLSASNVFIPIGAPIRWSLWRGNAAGFALNRFAAHPLMPMALRPK